MSGAGRDILLVHQLFVLGREAGGTRHVELARHLVRAGHRVTVVASPVSYLTGRRHAPVDEVGEPGIELLRMAADAIATTVCVQLT